MRELFSEYGKAIIATIIAGAVLFMALAPLPIGTDGTEITVLELMGGKVEEILQQNDWDLPASDGRTNPTITYDGMRLIEKTETNLKDVFTATDHEGHSIDKTILHIEDSDNNEMDIMQNGIAIFPKAGVFRITVEAVDNKNRKSVGFFYVPVDYKADDTNIDSREIVSYTSQHYKRTAFLEDDEHVTITNRKDEWEMFEEDKDQRTYKGNKVSTKVVPLEGYYSKPQEVVIQGGEVIKSYYEPDFCKIHITDNLGYDNEIKVVEGTEFVVNEMADEDYYKPQITVNQTNFNAGEKIAVTKDFLKTTISIHYEYLNLPTSADYKGEYDGKAHTIMVAPSDADSTVYYSTDNSTWSTNQVMRTDAGTTTVYYKISVPNREDIIGSRKITITPGAGWVSLNKGSDSTCTGRSQSFTVTMPTGVTSFTAKASNSVATVSINGRTVTVTPRSAGVSIITITTATGGNYSPATTYYTARFYNHEYYKSLTNYTKGQYCTDEGVNYYRCTCCGTTWSTKNGWFGAHRPGDVNNYNWDNRRDCRPGGWVSDLNLATAGGGCYTVFFHCYGCGGDINFACMHDDVQPTGEYMVRNSKWNENWYITNSPAGYADENWYTVYKCTKCGCKCTHYWHDAPTDYQNAYRAGNYEDYSMRQ